ncbi:uncharacterized protein LOC143286097 [Babylonia areolata]|uniref:uncharacterized protein LOC143286097 n=1 Tax=Babylonia areolata TaxID=304850 RepID=UPI003FD6BBF2
MINVSRMPSYSSEPLKYESYTTTPRSVALESSRGGNPISHDSEVDTNGGSITDPPSNHVTNRAGVRSAPSHFSAQVSQSLTEKLLDNSEQCSLDNALVFECSVVDDWSEAASGWGVVVPYPKYIAPQPQPQHKSQSVHKKGSMSGRTAVRCVDEDFGGQVCPSWKGNVEPVTYRYVPNNGYYRNHKPIRDVKEWPAMKRTKSEKFRVTPEMRQAQKTLKRDLENRFRSSGEESASSQNTSGAGQLVSGQYHETFVKSLQTGSQYRDRVPDTTSISKRLPAREQQLIKSASDLFMEKFNTRLSALEKELQTPSAPVVSKKSTTESTTAHNHSPRQMSKKLKDVRVPETMKPTIQSTKQHGSDFGEDLFTVIPMCKPEVPLRPLEKLTPKQKQMEKSTSSRDRSPSPEVQSEEEEEDDLMIMLACATSNPPPLPKDPDSQGISTARSAIAMTNFDIEKMRNISLQSEFAGNKPKPFLTQKEGVGGGGGRGMMRYTVGGGASNTHPTAAPPPAAEGMDRKEVLPRVDRPLESSLGSMGSSLPEIMGKRLSVIAATHRLL